MLEIIRIGRLVKIVKPVAAVIMVVKGAVDVVSFAVIENNIPRVPDSVIALALLACNDFALTVTDDFIIQQIKCARIARADCFAAYQRAVCAAGAVLTERKTALNGTALALGKLETEIDFLKGN